MIDLAALSAYQHYLNERASDEAIAAFNKLDLFKQAEIAADWVAHLNHRADYHNARKNGELW